jgi:hypothetical protein
MSVRTRPMANKPFFSDTARMAEQLGAKPLLPTDHDGAHLPSDGVLADGTPKLVPLDQARMKHRGFDENGEPILDWVGGGEAQDRTAATRAARVQAEAEATAAFRRNSLADKLQSVEERAAEAAAAAAAAAAAGASKTTELGPGGPRRKMKKKAAAAAAAAEEAAALLGGARRGLDIADRLLVDLARRLATISAPTGAERLKLGGALHESTGALLRLSRGGDAATAGAAASALSDAHAVAAVAAAEATQREAVDAGAVTPLVALLAAWPNDATTVARCVEALRGFAEGGVGARGGEARRQLADAGGIEALLSLLSDSADLDVIAEAGATLAAITRHPHELAALQQQQQQQQQGRDSSDSEDEGGGCLLGVEALPSLVHVLDTQVSPEALVGVVQTLAQLTRGAGTGEGPCMLDAEGPRAGVSNQGGSPAAGGMDWGGGMAGDICMALVRAGCVDRVVKLVTVNRAASKAPGQLGSAGAPKEGEESKEAKAEAAAANGGKKLKNQLLTGLASLLSHLTRGRAGALQGGATGSSGVSAIVALTGLAQPFPAGFAPGVREPGSAGGMGVELGLVAAPGTGDESGEGRAESADAGGSGGDEGGDEGGGGTGARRRQAASSPEELELAERRVALRATCHALRHIARRGGMAARNELRRNQGVALMTMIARNCADTAALRGAVHCLRHLAEGADGADTLGGGGGGDDDVDLGDGVEGEEMKHSWRDFEGMAPLTAHGCLVAAGTGGGGDGSDKSANVGAVGRDMVVMAGAALTLRALMMERGMRQLATTQCPNTASALLMLCGARRVRRLATEQRGGGFGAFGGRRKPKVGPSGGDETQAAAMGALRGASAALLLMADHEPVNRDAVAREATAIGGGSALLMLAHTVPDPRCRVRALSTLKFIGSDPNLRVSVGEAAPAQVRRCLALLGEAREEAVLRECAWALAVLFQDATIRAQVNEPEYITPLVQLLSSPLARPTTVLAAAEATKRLALDAGGHDALVAAGALTALVAVCKASPAPQADGLAPAQARRAATAVSTLAAAADALCYMCASREKLVQAAAAAGAVPTIVATMRRQASAPGAPRIRHPAVVLQAVCGAVCGMCSVGAAPICLAVHEEDGIQQLSEVRKRMLFAPSACSARPLILRPQSSSSCLCRFAVRRKTSKSCGARVRRSATWRTTRSGCSAPWRRSVGCTRASRACKKSWRSKSLMARVHRTTCKS